MVFTLGSSVGDDVKWQSAIDRALGTWESVVEWADYISFLSRVQKAIKNKHRCDGSKLPLAPQISEMLARCLEPALPAGVHQTCVDVYETIFTILGPKEISESIDIWLPGLLPVISWAAFNVKPLVVKLFSKYIIPAVKQSPKKLRKLYRPLLLSLLQSIEDESSDCYTEISELLLSLKNTSDKACDSLFWQCFYLCLITTPETRLGALMFLQKSHPDTKQSDLLIRAVCCGLEDTNVLVQRGFLDILAKHLPLECPELQTNKEDFTKLMLSACKTIYRKDMSLNRRLRLWLLGPERKSISIENEQGHVSRLDYLRKYSGDVLVNVLLEELSKNVSGTCVIAQGLMDRWEVGVTISPALLIPVLQHSYDSGTVEPNVSSFFDNVESNIVWDAVIKQLDKSPETVLFLVKNFNIQVEDMLAYYIPMTVLYILADHNLSEIKSQIAQELISVLPQQEIPVKPAEPLSCNKLRELISKSFHESLESTVSGEDETTSTYALSKKHISWYLLKLSGDVVLSKDSASILNNVLTLFPDTPGLEIDIPQCSELIDSLSSTSRDGVQLFIHLVGRMTPKQVRYYVQRFANSLAESLITTGRRQLERIKELWEINEATDGYVVPSAISVILANKSLSPFDRAKIFSGIWVHSADKNDVSTMLTKPLLLFMDIETEDKSLFYAYLQSSVVRTGTAPRMVKLLVDKLDLESRGDDAVFNYTLENFVTVLNNPEIRTAYVAKYAPLVCTLLLEWFDKSLLPEKAYAHALELAELTILDSRISDGKVWLRRFVDALTHSYVNEYHSLQNASNEKDSVVENNKRPISEYGSSIPLALLKFVTAAIPNLEQKSDIRLFIEICVGRLCSEVDYEMFNQLLSSLLASDSDVEYSLLKSIMDKLNDLDKPLLESTVDDIGENRGVLHLIAAIESIIATGLDVVQRGVSSKGSGGLTGAITGFQVESPEDRSRAEASLALFSKCLQIAVSQSCKYWLFLQRNKFSGIMSSGDYATALHTAGRLKTRLRKLMTLCYSSRPAETLRTVGNSIPDMKLAVRMTHMFEGARIGPTLELLLSMAAENDPSMFEFAANYVDSLETDVLGDVWPVLHQFLTNVVSNTSYISQFSGTLAAIANNSVGSSSSIHVNGSNENTSEKSKGRYSVLGFLTHSIVPRFEQLKLKNRKKFVREFADIYAKLLLTDTSDLELLSSAIKQMSIVITEPDRQASLLSRILNSLLKSPQDIAKGASFLNAVSTTFAIGGTGPSKIWTRHIGDFIFETRTEKDLMPITLEQSIELKPVIATWVQCDKERVKDFMSKLPTYGSSTGVLFGWSGTQELANSNLRRLAYITICTPPSILGVNWSKITNQLAGMWAQNAAAVCVLLRACILSRPSTTLMAFMSYRLQAVFRNTLNKNSLAKGDDAELLLEACKLVDLALVIGAEEFQPFEWLFISDNGDTIYNYAKQSVQNENYDVNQGSERYNSEKTEEKNSCASSKNEADEHRRAGEILEQLIGCAAIPRKPVPEQLVAPAPVFKGKRRPLLPERATLADVPAFLGQVSVTNQEEVYSMTVPDYTYCKRWVLADLFH